MNSTERKYKNRGGKKSKIIEPFLEHVFPCCNILVFLCLYQMLKSVFVQKVSVRALILNMTPLIKTKPLSVV